MGAIKAGRDPLSALGIPEPFRAEHAALVLELSQPPREGMGEAEADERVAKLLEKQEQAASWIEATMTGYTGPRGEDMPDVPPVPRERQGGGDEPVLPELEPPPR